MITVEPFPLDDGSETRARLLDDIADGRYDHLIDRLSADLAAAGQPVFLRWGHEMENVTGRYPWAQEDHLAYVRAYRHFVELEREASAAPTAVPTGDDAQEVMA